MAGPRLLRPTLDVTARPALAVRASGAGTGAGRAQESALPDVRTEDLARSLGKCTAMQDNLTPLVTWLLTGYQHRRMLGR